MALDYTVKYSTQIAQRFKRGSITDAAAGSDFAFTGARSVKVYSMTPAPLNTYGRGSTRYGDVTDLEYTTQEMLCQQAKSFTKHLEALDNSDIAVDAAAGKFLRMQLDEVLIPTMDKHRLKKWIMGGATPRQMDAAPTRSTIVGDIMALKGDMLDKLVPDTGLTLYILTPYYVMLKQAEAVVALEGMGTGAVEKGVVGTFDGMKVVPVPSSYFPAGVYFLIKHKSCTADPVKLAQYDVIRKSVGYSGPVVQGLAYYDSFVIGARNAGIGIAGSAEAVLDAPVITLSGGEAAIAAVTGVTFRYTTDGSDPRSSATAQDYTDAVPLAAGQTIRAVGTREGCVGLEADAAN